MVSSTDSIVLIQGETVTGRELIARAVHKVSPRCDWPFLKLNCAAIPFDLPEIVGRNEFREDRYYRLNVFPIHLPPLRERSENIPLLVRHYVQYFSSRMGKTIDTVPTETMDALTQYLWPGNIRELQNLIKRAVILSSGPVLQFPLFALQVCTIPPQVGGKHQTLEEAERAHILAAVIETNWVLSGPRGAVMRLGLNRSTLQFRMKKLGIAKSWTCESAM